MANALKIIPKTIILISHFVIEDFCTKSQHGMAWLNVDLYTKNLCIL